MRFLVGLGGDFPAPVWITCCFTGDGALVGGSSQRDGIDKEQLSQKFSALNHLVYKVAKKLLKALHVVATRVVL